MWNVHFSEVIGKQINLLLSSGQQEGDVVGGWRWLQGCCRSVKLVWCVCGPRTDFALAGGFPTHPPLIKWRSGSASAGRYCV